MKRRSKFIRVIGIALGSLALLVAAGLFAAAMKAKARLQQHYESHRLETAVPLPLAPDELAALRAERGAAATDAGGEPLAGVDLAALAAERARQRGKHLVEARYGCTACHGTNFGGGVMIDDPAFGNLRGPNITSGRGSVVARYTIADWDRIVRHGLKPSGLPAVMPSEDYFAMSDRELSDIVAYLRSVPPVDAEVPKPSVGPIGNVLIALGMFPLSAAKLPDHHRPHVSEPPATADTPEFGAHLTATCTTCHRSNLAGGPMQFGPPNWPAASNLTQHATGLANWTFEDFDKALTQGVRKDGQALREPMSHVVPSSRAMKPIERKAIWTYLRTLPALPTNP